MSRGDLRVKALLRAVSGYDRVRRHVAKLQGQRRHLISNPRAVRVVACSPSQSAFEATNRDGVEMGLFTDALSRALREAEGLRVNWSTLLDAVRRDVQELAPAQRPEAEGPSSRRLFAVAELDPLDSLPIVVTGPDRVQLLGAPLLGTEIGDEYAIRPPESGSQQDPGGGSHQEQGSGSRQDSGSDSDKSPEGTSGPDLAAATVDRLLPTSALAQLRFKKEPQEIPADARAHRVRAGAPAMAVRLPESHPLTAELERALAFRPLLRKGADAAVEVVADELGGLVVRDAAGPLHPPYPATTQGIGSVTANLQRLAQAQALRRLDGDLPHSVTVEWGRVHAGQEEPLPLSGALLHAYANERVYVRIRNEGAEAAYVSLVDIGVSARISVLTAADPGGVRLAPGAAYTYGFNDDTQRLTGVDVSWPEGIDTSAVRPETVLVLVSDGPVDVSVLQQQGVRTTRRPATALESLLAQIATGKTREIGDAPAAKVRYAVVPIDFTVSPTAPPAAETARFLVDDRPQQSARLLTTRGQQQVAVRIAELIVHSNRALGSADIRVDAVVLTGGPGDQPVYRAETMRFSNVRDHERLPLDNVLIYHGPAVDFLDIAVWVSRDATGSLALSALLEEKLNSPAFQAAGTGLSAVVPHAALAVAVMGAGAVLVNTAYELLSGVVGQSIGLYRTSLLAQEEFGAGRHERHPQDFSFTFTVDQIRSDPSAEAH